MECCSYTKATKKISFGLIRMSWTCTSIFTKVRNIPSSWVLSADNVLLHFFLYPQTGYTSYPATWITWYNSVSLIGLMWMDLLSTALELRRTEFLFFTEIANALIILKWHTIFSWRSKRLVGIWNHVSFCYYKLLNSPIQYPLESNTPEQLLNRLNMELLEYKKTGKPCSYLSLDIFKNFQRYLDTPTDVTREGSIAEPTPQLPWC